MIKHSSLEHMTTLSSVTSTAIKRGYTENFQIKHGLLYAPSNEIVYRPNDVKIDNFYRFEGASDPNDSSILYLLETHDGIKGMLIDVYGAGADAKLAKFISEIPELPKIKSDSKPDVEG